MFTELIRKGKWSFMFFAAVAVLAVAAVATLANTQGVDDTQSSASHEQGHASYGTQAHYNEATTMRFIN